MKRHDRQLVDAACASLRDRPADWWPTAEWLHLWAAASDVPHEARDVMDGRGPWNTVFLQGNRPRSRWLRLRLWWAARAWRRRDRRALLRSRRAAMGRAGGCKGV